MKEKILVIGLKEYETKKSLSDLSDKELTSIISKGTDLLPIEGMELSVKENDNFSKILFEIDEIDSYAKDEKRNVRIYNQYVFEELKILFLTYMNGISKELKEKMKKMLIDMSDYQYVVVCGKDL
ncbi:MAG: hypothetical protein ACRC41_11400 [Sarcina sp.]